MSFKITNNSLLERHYLEVRSDGIRFFYGALLAARRFRFAQIESVLLSSDSKLSIQVNDEVFSIPMNSENPNHKMALDFLLNEVRRTME
jgi:hypothetical protein